MFAEQSTVYFTLFHSSHRSYIVNLTDSLHSYQYHLYNIQNTSLSSESSNYDHEGPGHLETLQSII